MRIWLNESRVTKDPPAVTGTTALLSSFSFFLLQGIGLENTKHFKNSLAYN